MKGPGGSSCHQCKSRRNFTALTYCTSNLDKKKKKCRKKFCGHCLRKFYKETPQSKSNWRCPSCRKLCCCAACRRRKEKESGGSSGEKDLPDSPVGKSGFNHSSSAPPPAKKQKRPPVPDSSDDGGDSDSDYSHEHGGHADYGAEPDQEQDGDSPHFGYSNLYSSPYSPTTSPASIGMGPNPMHSSSTSPPSTPYSLSLSLSSSSSSASSSSSSSYSAHPASTLSSSKAPRHAPSSMFTSSSSSTRKLSSSISSSPSSSSLKLKPIKPPVPIHITRCPTPPLRDVNVPPVPTLVISTSDLCSPISTPHQSPSPFGFANDLQLKGLGGDGVDDADRRAALDTNGDEDDPVPYSPPSGPQTDSQSRYNRHYLVAPVRDHALKAVSSGHTTAFGRMYALWTTNPDLSRSIHSTLTQKDLSDQQRVTAISLLVRQADKQYRAPSPTPAPHAAPCAYGSRQLLGKQAGSQGNKPVLRALQGSALITSIPFPTPSSVFHTTPPPLEVFNSSSTSTSFTAPPNGNSGTIVPDAHAPYTPPSSFTSTPRQPGPGAPTHPTSVAVPAAPTSLLSSTPTSSSLYNPSRNGLVGSPATPASTSYTYSAPGSNSASCSAPHVPSATPGRFPAAAASGALMSSRGSKFLPVLSSVTTATSSPAPSYAKAMVLPASGPASATPIPDAIPTLAN